ncbi:unnamed protein product [Notodromas monacha]|uniref:Chromo domain-containing protein n=1 Tax=Notodromas monacha TaxID=399045 RepID=A0A7R9BQE4_9CRUS|nr:unnamed protein product [Notodromas monacha]CAG0919756.1 unnamed protein product [Notodromas monacha]
MRRGRPPGRVATSSQQPKEEYVVERIIDRRYRNGKKEYFLSWKGYPPEYDSWEPEDNLDCPDLVAQFEVARAQNQQTNEKDEALDKLNDPSPGIRRIRGFSEGWKPEKILAASKYEGDLIFLMKWEGHDETELVPAKVCNHKCPQVVNRMFNSVCGDILTAGLQKVSDRLESLLREIKHQLPKRESGRMNHPLAEHLRMLNVLDSRITFLKMTYRRFMEANLCPFIPGKVLDEMVFVLDMVGTKKKLVAADKVMDSLRDYSSMAIEHFEDEIAPIFTSEQKDLDVCTSVQKKCKYVAPLMMSPALGIIDVKIAQSSGTFSGAKSMSNFASEKLLLERSPADLLVRMRLNANSVMESFSSIRTDLEKLETRCQPSCVDNPSSSIPQLVERERNIKMRLQTLEKRLLKKELAPVKVLAKRPHASECLDASRKPKIPRGLSEIQK